MISACSKRSGHSDSFCIVSQCFGFFGPVLFVILVYPQAFPYSYPWLKQVFFLPKSITNSLILQARWLLPHHPTKALTRPLYSPSCPPLIHPIITESHKKLCRCTDSELYLKVWGVKYKQERWRGQSPPHQHLKNIKSPQHSFDNPGNQTIQEIFPLI